MIVSALQTLFMEKNYSQQTLKIYWQHIQKYRWSFFILIFSVIAASVANLVGPIFYKKFFDAISSAVGSFSDAPALIKILLMILAVNVIAWFFWRLTSFTLVYFESHIIRDLYNTCFAYLHKHSFSFFNNNFVGSLVKRVNRFHKAFEGIGDLLFFEVLGLVISIFFIITVVWSRSWALGVGILAWVIVYCLANYFFSIYKLKFDLEKSLADSEVTAVLADTITNNRNVKLFNGYDRENKFFAEVTGKLKKLQMFAWNLGNKFEAIQTILMIILEFGIFYLAIGLWQRGLVTIGDFVLLQSYILVIFHRLWNFGRIIRRYYENISDANEMTEILLTEHGVRDVLRAKNLQLIAGAIEFSGVDFNYHNTRKVFGKLNLTIKAKEKIALVGPSGCGKSTLVNLLLRNYDLAGGHILIDGQKISQVTQASLWHNVSLVPQDPILFHRTLKENIRYGQPKATDQEVVLAAELANCHEFISQLSDGYETYVGERGVKLSGGERQRVAIARAILKNSPILIFDEATSSLDSESEKLIQDALNILMKDKTVIVIAHRLSTIIKMDRIIVFDQGKIIEQGTHQQLLKIKNGFYKNLWDKQVGGFLSE